MAPPAFSLSVADGPPTQTWRRMLACTWRQGSRTPACPAEPSQSGCIALVTGGNTGCGLEVARGLLARNAQVIITCRSPEKAEAAVQELHKVGGAGSVTSVALDLADLDSVPACVAQLREQLGGKQIMTLVENAGVWPAKYGQTKQGHELAFGTNVLGHFALRSALQEAGLLADSARVVVVTGDIYIKAKQCTSDFKYSGGGEEAYCRSKLGNLWVATELQCRHPNLHVVAVHPGVFASGLIKVPQAVKTLLFLIPATAAQMPLIAATQPVVEKGAYLHNTYGVMRLQASDPGRDIEAAKVLWARLEELAKRQ